MDTRSNCDRDRVTPIGCEGGSGLRRRHHAGQSVRLDRYVIHALLLGRMMFLESRWQGRTRAELVRDPVYTRYLTQEDITALITASGAAGEPPGT
ncbi:hypothetical protein [Micromonospora sp. NPDC005324]|uniref:hypothetical protein n=1 Tax=Micromonospora sp. NPDC005324 TaxID=3157033 RepID=UPI0033A8AE4C